MRLCNACNSGNIYEDDTLGEFSCDDCGFVWQADTIIDCNVEFDKTNTGKKVALGYEVYFDSNKQLNIKRRKDQIAEIAMKLKLPKIIVDRAVSLYEIALNKGFSRGIKGDIFSAVVLRIAADECDTLILPIEYSNAISVEEVLFVKIYKRLKEKLNVKTKKLNFTLYIEKFINKLNINDKKAEIKKYSKMFMYLLMQHSYFLSRKPRTNCAIALYLACKKCNIIKNLKDVADISGLRESSLKSILMNVKKWQLTIDEPGSKNYETPKQLINKKNDMTFVNNENEELSEDEGEDESFKQCILSDEDMQKRIEWKKNHM